MEPRVGVVGVGWSAFSPTTPGVSYKELMFEAARTAYADAGIDPRSEIDSFVCASEDFEEGTSIFDEYVPDQLGAAQRPVQTVASDGLFAIATAVMLIRSGIARIVAVEAHSKASDVVSHGRIERFALDPVLNRPLGVPALAVAGLEMRRYLYESGRTEEGCADVAARNREHAAANPRAAYAHVTDPTVLFDPLTSEQAARSTDGCVVTVLAAEDRGRHAAVWVDGVGWSQDAPSLESRHWGEAVAARRAGEMAYRQAEMGPGDVDVAEVDDTFAYKQLQHLDALGLQGLDPSRVNRSGGALGEGYLHEANGLARFLACVEQLRAGDGRIGVAQSWRGVPSSSAAVAVVRGAG
ncbi:MAG: thiolase C-terminal domain-containing protein [Actinomycetota bacterium]